MPVRVLWRLSSAWAERETTAEDETPPLVYADAGQLVQEWLLPHYRRNLNRRKWDLRWWAYEEAGRVLEALWESWGQMRHQDATAAVLWFRDLMWPIMDHLTSEDGPFWAYDPPTQSLPPTTWPTEPPPKARGENPIESHLYVITRDSADADLRASATNVINSGAV